MTGWLAGRLNLQSSDDIFAEVPGNVGRSIVCLLTAQSPEWIRERETVLAETSATASSYQIQRTLELRQCWIVQ